jgi:hypothetical protein
MEEAVMQAMPKPAEPPDVPRWDGSTLIARGKTKAYKQPAPVQRSILQAFQSAKWAHSIPNPRANSATHPTKSECAARLTQLGKDVDNLNRTLSDDQIPITFSTDGNDCIIWEWKRRRASRKQLRRS